PPPAPAVATAGLRPVAPLSGSRCTAQRPTLRFATAPGRGDARLELCRDPTCARVERTIDVRGGAHRPDAPLAAGRWYWRLRDGAAVTPIWAFEVPARDAPVATCRLSWTDVNGDGRADAAFGEPSVSAT